MLAICQARVVGLGTQLWIKKKKKILPSLWSLHVLFGNAERKKVRGAAKITGEIVGRGKKMMARRN